MQILECDVRHVRMPSLLQLCEGEMYTGRVRLAPGGVIAVRSGSVVGAETTTGLNGVAAMRELFLMPEGNCKIELDANVEGAPIDTTIGIILDGCKLLDEWNELAGERLVVSKTKPPAELKAAFAALREVIAEMRTGSTLYEAVTDTGAHRSIVITQVMKLMEAGVLEVGGEAPVEPDPIEAHPVAPPPLPTQASGPKSGQRERPVHRIDTSGVDLDELVTQARGFIRSGHFDDAEQLLRAALERNPNDRVLAQNLRHLALRRAQEAY